MNQIPYSPGMAALVKFLMAASLIPLLAACAPDFNPPPDYQGGFLWNTDKSRTITVESGDSLYAISQRYDVPIKVIVARNALQPPYALTSGQELVLDPVRTHRVVAGETLDGIAAQYGVDVSLIAQANDLQPPYAIHPDQDIWIPDPFTVAAATTAPATPDSADLARPSQTVMGSQVASAESLRGSVIAVETLPPPPGTPVAPDFGPLPQPNGPAPVPLQALQSPASLGPVAIPQAPPSAPQPLITQTQPPTVPQPVIQQTPPTATPSTLPPAPPTIAAAPEIPAAASTAPAQVASIPPAATTEPIIHPAAHFIWPVKGRLISGFGPAGKGLHNDGINIAAPLGTQVRAVDNGVVAYAGSELKGFGNLLLIKHADGLTTAYAHNDKLLVAKGDVVKQGQVVATVGKTGGVDSPQLHFEVRVGTQAVDPEEYLQQTASH